MVRGDDDECCYLACIHLHTIAIVVVVVIVVVIVVFIVVVVAVVDDDDDCCYLACIHLHTIASTTQPQSKPSCKSQYPHLAQLKASLLSVRHGKSKHICIKMWLHIFTF